MEELAELKDELEPFFWEEEIDGFLDKVEFKNEYQKKLFDICKFKVKIVTFLFFRIEGLDKKYAEMIKLKLKNNQNEQLVRSYGDIFVYTPYMLKNEFQSLMFQAKSFLDIYSRAVGLYFQEHPPNKIKSLSSVVEEKSNSGDKLAIKLFNVIKNSEQLKGIALDPDNGKKSLRDIVTHLDDIDIFYLVNKKSETEYKLIRENAFITHQSKMTTLPNYLVKNISSNVYLDIRELFVETLRALIGNSSLPHVHASWED